MSGQWNPPHLVVSPSPTLHFPLSNLTELTARQNPHNAPQPRTSSPSSTPSARPRPVSSSLHLPNRDALPSLSSSV